MLCIKLKFNSFELFKCWEIMFTFLSADRFFFKINFFKDSSEPLLLKDAIELKSWTLDHMSMCKTRKGNFHHMV